VSGSRGPKNRKRHPNNKWGSFEVKDVCVTKPARVKAIHNLAFENWHGISEEPWSVGCGPWSTRVKAIHNGI